MLVAFLGIPVRVTVIVQKTWQKGMVVLAKVLFLESIKKSEEITLGLHFSYLLNYLLSIHIGIYKAFRHIGTVFPCVQQLLF